MQAPRRQLDECGWQDPVRTNHTPLLEQQVCPVRNPEAQLSNRLDGGSV
jgi:hypothetical protein